MSHTLTNCLQIAQAVRSHERTARSVTDAALARAESLQEEWKSFIRITPETARQQAEQVDRAVGRGQSLPLAGVPFAVKDLMDVAGLPTTCGSRVFENRQADQSAEVVQRLTRAGAVLIGKLNMHECAFGFTGENPNFGDCKNPWNAAHICGGSSSGSATAVALGICPLTLGSDTGGSIRLPAALCSLVGLKPTYGRVSRSGVTPLSWSMDHVGPMTRTAEEAALALHVLAGHDLADESSSRRQVPKYRELLDEPLRGLRLGVPGAWFFDSLQADVATRVEAALKLLVEMGCDRQDVQLPHLDEVLGAHRAIIFSEASSFHLPFLKTRGSEYGDDIRPLLQGGAFLPEVDYLQAQRWRRIVRREWAPLFQQVDFLLTPTSPLVASRFGATVAQLPRGEKPLVRAYLDFSLPFNLSGHPAVSVPCGFSTDAGLPIGMQLVGRSFDEATILRVAHQYQRRTQWHERIVDLGS